MSKKTYKTPKVVFFTEQVRGGVPGALYGAILMVGRALSKAMKGGIDLTAGTDAPKLLQVKNDVSRV